MEDFHLFLSYGIYIVSWHGVHLSFTHVLQGSEPFAGGHFAFHLVRDPGVSISFFTSGCWRTGDCDNKGGRRAPFHQGVMLPQKNLKFRSSEMQFPAFWASKRVFL